ncbi:MAG: NAD-dependent epimerase/dehydratase family protein, partial [bacterium]
MKYLVTGGAGFIGSHIAEHLAKADQEVIVYDNLSSGKLTNLESFKDKVEFVNGDIRDNTLLGKVMAGVDIVFHEAAVASVAKSVEDPVMTDAVNVGGTVSVLTAAKDNGVKKVVFASSAAIYGDDPELPKREEMQPKPLSPYAFHKLAGEYYLRLFHQLYGLNGVALRYFNVFGPRQDPSSEYSGVISIFLDRFKRDAEYTIYGDGEQSRDFIFVQDVARANLAAAAIEFDHVPIINVACNHANNLLQLVEHLQEISGATRAPKFGPERLGDIKHSLADNSRLKSLLGVAPEVGFREGLRRL